MRNRCIWSATGLFNNICRDTYAYWEDDDAEERKEAARRRREGEVEATDDEEDGGFGIDPHYFAAFNLDSDDDFVPAGPQGGDGEASGDDGIEMWEGKNWLS